MKVLFCPLNWGLGHATRCIPLIRQHIEQGDEVIIATEGHPEALLRHEFPNLKYIQFPSYDIRYQSGKTQIFAMLMSLPRIFAGIVRERRWIHHIMKKEKFDLIISDNRFALWHKDAISIYITHQLMIKMPFIFKWAEPLVWLGHRFFINRYDHCYIPDFSGTENLSGDLSHLYPLPENAKFIGPLSRFSDQTPPIVSTYKIVGLVSGPEPTRTLFETYLIERLQAENTKSIIIRGLPSNNTNIGTIGKIDFLNHTPSSELAQLLQGADKIICRSGYTTIMDLHRLSCLHKAEFHPTPGQTEQEYLAVLHKKDSI